MSQIKDTGSLAGDVEHLANAVAVTADRFRGAKSSIMRNTVELCDEIAYSLHQIVERDRRRGGER